MTASRLPEPASGAHGVEPARRVRSASVTAESVPSRRGICVRLVGIDGKSIRAVVEALLRAGISEIDVDMNAARAARMVSDLVDRHDRGATIGAAAGTAAQVREAADAGAHAVSLPGSDPKLVRAANKAGLAVRACAFTTTECLQALDAGADALLLYPARVLDTDGAQALMEYLPPDAVLYAHGGVGVRNIATWANAGIERFYVGSALYRSGCSIEQVDEAATELTTAYDRYVLEPRYEPVGQGHGDS